LAEHILIVPPTGLLEVIHADKPIDALATLAARGGEGEFVRLSHGQVTANWFSSEQGWLNPRAREVFARLTKVHLLFTGNVLFQRIEEKELGEIVAALSVRTG
jgi:hypothetical protein